FAKGGAPARRRCAPARSRSARSRSDGLVCRRDGAVAWRESLAWPRPFPDHIFHRYRCHFGLAVVWRCSQSDVCKLVAAAWLVGATNSTPGTDHSQHGDAARSRYCFIRSATAYGSSRLRAPERGSARSPTRGWPATSGGQHRQAPRRRAEDSSEAPGNSAEALGNSARGDRCTGAQTAPGNGASVPFRVSITFTTSALRPTTSRSGSSRCLPTPRRCRGAYSRFCRSALPAPRRRAAFRAGDRGLIERYPVASRATLVGYLSLGERLRP